MPNQLSFDVEFKREDIEAILTNPNAKYIYVAGTYTYEPATGSDPWIMKAFAVGCDDNNTNFAPQIDGCIRPCPRGVTP